MELTSQQTVAEIAATSLAAIRVFETHGIDYCCGGHRPLADACRSRGIAPETILGELSSALQSSPAAAAEWNSAALSDLIRHIVTTHHEYLKLELPRIQQRLDKVHQVYGQQDASVLAPLPGLFFGLRQELELHMRKEEAILFPTIERYERAAGAGAPLPFVPFGSIANPIRMMEMEHENAGDALRQMREITSGYTAPAHACSTYRALFQGLDELERDLHMHIHLENNILFPRAIALESSHR